MPMPDFQRFETVIYFAKNTFAGKITLDNVNKDQANLVTEFITRNNRTKQRTREYLQKKNTYESMKTLFARARAMIPNAFKSGIFPIPPTEGTEIKILTPKQMLHILPIVFA